MADSYDLSILGSQAFENIVNFLALKTLGLGNSGFGPGADGGRDGYFEGEAPYPSQAERWKGVWYIQSKFHAPHLSKNPQQWLVEQVAHEIKAFDAEQSDRSWPDNWIIATNIDQSGKPETGSFDAIRKRLKKSSAGRKVKVHVWGGRKILDLLSMHGDVARYYGHLLTPGHVISALYNDLADKRASIEEIARFFVVGQFSDHLFTKLDQAGSSSDVRPGVHDLFIDLPFSTNTGFQGGALLAELCSASAQCHRYSLRKEFPESWRDWNKHSRRARVALIKGGPGQGKSTIGQYLCQIHRACLILSEDGPTVVDSIKNAATAVRAAAQRDKFWPTSPRIPIQIELKEFAHWYSQRPPSQPQNVLTYIAETVAKKIGSEVFPKTIKSALSKRSWIVVFDGLDEVPNDFKDSVAKEVMYFLNDVLVEIDSDVLALCTSRPQGYSGQFAGLDGPVIELVQLDVAAAMRCAKPLLAFGRSTEESEKSIATLETAIRSPNVQELMTTPLQSHIMAVVVRDGGRPPERRWQLFNSFYLVMKKRESLKNFQDSRIAKLLREEDRLLKSVHMRLGFVLHARAERSEGAQTTLSKEEFRHLVRDVVTQLVDHEIEETVAGVMEATTERLVLVSTPESGEQVRFDIRQLQEFFAAEFLYASVDSSELAARIETIGGDAHWREVMHFLMSALIENQRTTDLAVSVQVLRKLNEGEESNVNSLYPRRMARAGMLASRLLIEGVLEQDQRDRQQIRPLFEPLGGVLDLDSLRGLTRLSPTRSRQWLIQLLLERLSTANPRENVGALFVLGWLLPDDAVQSSVAILALMNCPIGFQDTLCRHWRPSDIAFFRGQMRRKPTDGILSQWVVEFAVAILNSPNWVNHTADAIGSLLTICSSEESRFVAACSARGLDARAADALLRCISMLSIDRTAKGRHSGTTIDCGVLKATPYLESWSNGKIPERLIGIDARRHASESDGAFRLMLTCLWFAQERSGPAVEELVRLVDLAGPERVGTLPVPLLALVPIGGEHSAKPYAVDHLRNIGAIAVGSLASQALEKVIAPSYADLGMSVRKEPTREQWRLLALHLPMIAINVSFNPEHMPWTGKLKFTPELLSVIDSMPSVARQFILKWGYLQDDQTEFLTNLKAKLRLCKSEKWQPTFHSGARVVAFKLELPADIPLLSTLAPALVERFKETQQDSFRRHLEDPQTFSLHTAMMSYGLEEDALRGIAESSIHDQTVRAGALALYWLLLSESEAHSRERVAEKLNLAQERALYATVVNEINEAWLTFALVRGVLTAFSEMEAGALAFVTYLMERCLDGNGPRDQLIELLGRWRERSTAPVHGKQVLQTWLGYNFQAPGYAAA